MSGEAPLETRAKARSRFTRQPAPRRRGRNRRDQARPSRTTGSPASSSASTTRTSPISSGGSASSPTPTATRSSSRARPRRREQARRVLERLYERVRDGGQLSLGDVDGVIQETALQGSLFPVAEPGARRLRGDRHAQAPGARPQRGAARLSAGAEAARAGLRARARPAPARPSSPSATPCQLLERGAVERLILSRPAVEAGERLGFLPGDMKEKVDPYLRPIYDALYDFMEARQVERGLQTGHDRDRAARLHARPHADQRLRHPRRGAEHHAHADEDVPHPPRRGLADGRHRRPHPDRPAAGPEVRPGRGGAHPRRASRASAASPSPRRRGAPRSRPPHRRRLRGRLPRGARRSRDREHRSHSTSPASADAWDDAARGARRLADRALAEAAARAGVRLRAAAPRSSSACC